ncbi:Hypothetical predicted protein [Mytilus galloprovincialis]|uniref:SAM domain-containing protein n=1 Tax=Mytilus galloprovincialis TaxID=29158 RepID=A0A8B6C733_MYTGA|nr:Hypothetical predicted protein [Mytilus galloprovincialis]
MSEIEGKSIKELGEWLANVKKVEEDVILTLEEAEIDGALFLQLKVDDLQDLFKSFVKRKKIRDIIRQVQEKEEPEEDIPVPFQPSRFSSPIASGPSSSPIPPKFSQIPSCSSSESFSLLMSPSRDTSPSSGNIKVPISQILENPGEYCSKDIEMERAKIVRKAMDSMVVGCEGRPNESTILMMAKAMALKYPVLRDSRDGPLKDNYQSLKGFLRRRMYNTTAATTNRGRKRKRDSVDSEKDSSCVNNLNESSLGSITSADESIAIPIDVDLPNTLECRDIAVVSNGGDTEKDLNPNSEQEHIEKGKKVPMQVKVIHIHVHIIITETQETVAETPAETPKRAEEVLMKEIKSMTKDSNKNDVFQLLNLTMAKRNADQEGMSVRLRFENLRENYKLFLNSKFVSI